MNIEKRLAVLFGMDDATWRRHANGWSVWTRVATLPVLLLAVWSHAWLGWWAAVPVAAVLVWTWLNPRLFPPPRTTDTWAAKGTFGERVWIARKERAVPEHHRVVPHLLAAAAGIGFLVAVWGALTNTAWPAVLGGALAMLAKLWFVDRMVWLYDDMKDADPVYRSWLY